MHLPFQKSKTFLWLESLNTFFIVTTELHPYILHRNYSFLLESNTGSREMKVWYPFHVPYLNEHIRPLNEPSVGGFIGTRKFWAVLCGIGEQRKCLGKDGLIKNVRFRLCLPHICLLRKCLKKCLKIWLWCRCFTVRCSLSDKLRRMISIFSLGLQFAVRCSLFSVSQKEKEK